MADNAYRLEQEDPIAQNLLSIGWHLVQGEQLSGSYAKAAEGAGETEWASFFRGLETAYRETRVNGTQGLLRLPDFDLSRCSWCRPPW